MNKDKAQTKQVVYNCRGNNIFKIALHEEQFIIVMGNYMASDKRFDKIEDAEEYIESKPYELILNMTLIHNIYEKENKKIAAKKMETDTQESV